MATQRHATLARTAIDSDQLRAVLAAAEAGSLSGAARALGAQLSTVSRRIAELERRLDVTLFSRTGRGVRPTEVGERYIERARRALFELDAGEGEARGEGDAHRESLRVSAPVELSLQLLPPVIAQWSTRFPSAQLELHSDARRVSLLEEDYDAAVRLGALQSSQLLARKLGEIAMVIAARPERAAQLTSVSALGEAECALVHGASSALTARRAGRALRIELRASVRVSTFFEAARLAALSDRFVLAPSFTARPWIERGELARVPVAIELPTVPVYWLYPQRHRGSRALRALGDAVAAALADEQRPITGRRAAPRRGRPETR